MENKNSLMNNNWKILKFSDCIIQINTGLNPRNNFSLGNGKIKYITAKNLTKSGIIDFTKCDFIDEKAKSIIHKRSDIEIGDILLSSRAPIGHCHLIREKPCFYDIGESIFSIRVNRKIVLPDYLCLYLTSNYFVKSASLQTTGSIISEIRISDLMNTKIIVPPIYIQNDIAECLYKIDYKIELNKKINDNLQHQLKLIYDYWFTQFDFPDENGKPYRSSGGAMVWNEQLKREIPVGWSVTSIMDNELFHIVKPGIDNFVGSKTYLATADIVGTNIQKGSVIDYDTRESRANMQPTIYSVWFAKMKKSIKHLYLESKMKSIIDSHILSTGFCGLQCSQISFEYVASFIEHSNFELIKDTLAHGATQEAVNNDDLCNIFLINPSYTVLQLYHETTKGIYSKISTNICESQKLSALRDWLLPMLMNGQATISD